MENRCPNSQRQPCHRWAQRNRLRENIFLSQEKMGEKIPIKIDGIDQRMKAIKEQTGKTGNKIKEKCIKLSHSPQGV